MSATPAPLVTSAQVVEIMRCPASELAPGLLADLNASLTQFKITNRREIAYFLGQCGHESGGLRYRVEIASGRDYEGRRDLGNLQSGDGPKYRGCGYIQVTGRHNHSKFSQWLVKQGRPDPRVMAEGTRYTSAVYPWRISAFWWWINGMSTFCARNPSVDAVGARVNGANPPNGAADRREYTARAFRVLGVTS